VICSRVLKRFPSPRLISIQDLDSCISIESPLNSPQVFTETSIIFFSPHLNVSQTMLKVIKRKAKEQDAVNPRIDISLVLSEQKMSWNPRSIPPSLVESNGDSHPPTVTLASRSGSSSIASKDIGAVDDQHPTDDAIRPLQQPTVPVPFLGLQNSTVRLTSRQFNSFCANLLRC
jgi:hypothetical protein